MSMRWRFGIIAAVFMALFTLYPQFKLIYNSDGNWNGHYAYNDIDEVAYASYVAALIDGRPRKNDPYSGKDDSAETPQEESLFSIQFAAPYTIALPSRILGIGAPWAMTIAGALAGILAVLAAFWLIWLFTENNWFAMAGSLAIFAFGALAAGEGAIGEITGGGFSYPYFPGFRRYIPALGFPAFFALIALVWKFVDNDEVRPRNEQKSSSLTYTALAGPAFAYIVFSYFYLWTTAVAWLVALFLVWLVARPAGFFADLKKLSGFALFCAAIMLPYAWLLSNRSHTMDEVQLLVYTRLPDLFRVPEYISVFVILLIAVCSLIGILRFRDRRTLFIFSLALVPLIVFNQQILTGRELQPIHYQVFIGNYVAMAALVLAVGNVLKEINFTENRAIVYLSAVLFVAAVAWGFVECHYTVRVLDDANLRRDQGYPIGNRLSALARGENDPHRSTVLAFDMIIADDLPTIAPQNVLWARHQHVFAGLTWAENKERYYQYLYFSGHTPEQLEVLLKRDFVTMIALFGWGRHTTRLSSDAKPLSEQEIFSESEKYRRYIEHFNRETAAETPVSYLIVADGSDGDHANFDRWYTRDAGERIGGHILYKTALRPQDVE